MRRIVAIFLFMVLSCGEKETKSDSDCNCEKCLKIHVESEPPTPDPICIREGKD